MADRTELQSVVTWEHVRQTAVLEMAVSKFDPSGLANIPQASQDLILEEANREVIFFRWQGFKPGGSEGLGVRTPCG